MQIRSIVGASAVSLPLVASLAISTTTQEALSKEEAAVEACVLDYVQGFYTADVERIERALSSDVKKMGYWRPDADSQYSEAKHMTFEEAKKLAATWNADGKQGKDLPYEIELFEVVDKTASAKLTAKWGMDYFHLVKEGEAWKIHHVLWQSAPPAASK